MESHGSRDETDDLLSHEGHGGLDKSWKGSKKSSVKMEKCKTVILTRLSLRCSRMVVVGKMGYIKVIVVRKGHGKVHRHLLCEFMGKREIVTQLWWRRVTPQWYTVCIK